MCPRVCIFKSCMLVPMESRKGCWSPQNWSYRSLEPPDTGAENQTQVFCKCSK